MLDLTYTCDACGAKANALDYGMTLFVGMPLPEGWVALRGKHYCAAHEISIVPRPGLRNTPAYPGQRPCNMPTLSRCEQVKRYKAEHVGRFVTFGHHEYDFGRRYETVTGVYEAGPGRTLVGPVSLCQPPRRLGPAYLLPADWRPKYEPYTSPIDTEVDDA